MCERVKILIPLSLCNKIFARTKMQLFSLRLFILFGIKILLKINQSKYENELRGFAPIMYIWSNWLFTYCFEQINVCYTENLYKMKTYLNLIFDMWTI